MRFGRRVEDGFLPVYSVETEEKAKMLLTVACSTQMVPDENGIPQQEYIARELSHQQTQENLAAFSDRLAEMEKMIDENAAKRKSEKLQENKPELIAS